MKFRCERRILKFTVHMPFVWSVSDILHKLKSKSQTKSLYPRDAWEENVN